MQVNASQSGRTRVSGSTAAAAAHAPRYPSDTTTPMASAAHLATMRSGLYPAPPPRHAHSPSATNVLYPTSSTSYDGGKRLHRGDSGPPAPELDLNGSTNLNMRPQRRGSSGSNSDPLRDAIVQPSASPQPPSVSQRQQKQKQQQQQQQQGGVLLGSLAGYLPASAVALANASVTPAPPPQPSTGAPHASSPRVNAKPRGVDIGTSTTNGVVAAATPAAAGGGPQDLHSSRQSITVVRVTHDGAAQDNTCPPSNMSISLNGSSTPDLLGGPAVPPRKATLNQVGGQNNSSSYNNYSNDGRPLPLRRVQREAIAPIPLSDNSISADFAAPPLSSRVSAAAAKQPRPVPPPPATRTRSSTSPHHIQHQQHHQHQSQWNDTNGGDLVVRAQPPRPSPGTALPPAAAHGTLSPAQYASGRGAVLHHSPSPAAMARYGASHNGSHSKSSAVVSTEPATLQISTTTLTKACKKVRYLLPNVPFDPDAPDPTDNGGLTPAEEEALLDPVNYTRAADTVAGRYPMLLRRPSAQGGDLLRGPRGSGGGQPETAAAPRPTFLLDDGNHWARETNRPALATTRDPAGSSLTQLPSPSILQKGRASRHNEAVEPFPAYQKTGKASGSDDDAAAGGYLLQRHVQQMATGKQLVEGTVFQPPPMTQRQRERRQREEEENRLDAEAAAAAAAAAAQRSVSPSRLRGNSAKAPVEACYAKPRRGPVDGLYEEIIRRTNQSRRAALPAKVMAPPAASTTMPPLAPSSTTVATASGPSSRPPIAPQTQPRGVAAASGRRGRPHPNSAEPTPVHSGAGVNPSPHEQQRQLLRPPPRSSSQPYITNVYPEGTPNGSDTSGTPQDYYNCYNNYRTANIQPETGAGTPLPFAPSPPQRKAVRPPMSNSNNNSSSVPTQRHRTSDARLQDSPPPRQQQPSLEATPNYSVASTTPSMPGYTSGRFSKYNPPGSAPPPPPSTAPPQQQQRQQQQQQQRAPNVQRQQRTTAALPPPPQPNAAYPSPYDDDDAYAEEAGNYTNDEDDYAAADADEFREDDRATQRHVAGKVHAKEAVYPSDDDDDDAPVMDAAGARMVYGAGSGPVPVRNNNSNNNGSKDNHNNTSSGSAGAEVRRSLLEQYSNGDDEVSQDTPRGTRSSQKPQQQQQRRQGQATSAGAQRQVAQGRVQAPLPPTATRKAAQAGEVNQSQGAYEEAPSVSSCDTDTQPVPVSERGSDEMNEEDDLVKKGPLVLKLGDEVYAAEGYFDEEYDEEQDDKYEDDVEGGEGGEDSEVGYWESEPPRSNHDAEGSRAGGAGAAAAATTQRSGSVRYDEEAGDEL